MIITVTDKIYKADLTLLSGVQRNRLNGSDFTVLRNGGWDIYLYENPVYDPATQKLTDLQIVGDRVIQTVEDKTQVELDAELEAKRAGMIVSAWQFRKALNQLNLRDTVEAAIAASEGYDMKDAWEYANTFDRDNELVITMGAALGKTEAELDAIFELAQTL